MAFAHFDVGDSDARLIGNVPLAALTALGRIDRLRPWLASWLREVCPEASFEVIPQPSC